MIATLFIKLLSTALLSLNLCHSDCGRPDIGTTLDRIETQQQTYTQVGTALSCERINGTVVCYEG